MSTWPRHAIVAFTYAIVYGLVRTLPFPYWALYSGIRLATLIFVPRRYWPALAIGEFLPLTHLAATCVDEFGLLWAIFIVFPTPILAAMPIVAWCMDKHRMLPCNGSVRMGVLLLTMTSVAVLWTLMSTTRLTITELPENFEIDYGLVIAQWSIKNFLGVLAIVPLAIMMHEVLSSPSPGKRVQEWLDNRLLIETVFLVIPTVSLLLWAATRVTSEGTLQVLRVVMFLPVVFHALRHGWHGAAVGGALTSVAEVLTMASPDDVGALQAQVFIAFTITSMLMLGSRITALNQQEAHEREQTHNALALARKNIAAGEMRLQLAAEFLDEVRESIRVGYEHMVCRTSLTASEEDRRCVRHVAIAQDQLFRLSDGLYPSGWCDTDLLSALRQGPFARALSEAGVRYWCDITGNLSQLSSGSHLTLYRLVGECVAQACRELPPTDVRVRLRVGVFHGETWVGLRVRSWTEPEWVTAIRLTDVRLRLGGTGLDWEAAEDRVRTFQGRMRQIVLPRQGRSIRATLKDWLPPQDMSRSGSLLAVQSRSA
ncbi:MAG TPA: MASE1 domain-containing protein [Dyella sp.]|uniref:MASE1 domain-containing protein n=1 Tax=Dyella sp. TaxID=1869338 RepID=UPI002F92A186